MNTKTSERTSRHLELCLAGLLLVLVGCTEPDDDEQADPGPPVIEENGEVDPQDTMGQDLDITTLVEEVAPSIVAVEAEIPDLGAVAEAAGSGVIWSADGVIVTNNHVVAEAQELEVVFADGSRVTAETIAADPSTDLAVLRVDADGLPAATFADSLPEIGETAIALGNPLGFQNMATAGIISGLDRTLPVAPDAPPLVGMIQTDAAISSGNSGGALINARGIVVGINTAVVDIAEGPVVAQGLGFAIPATTVGSVVEQLLETGEVRHPQLGIQGITLTPPLADRFGIERDQGVLVGAVQPDSPAEDVGLRQGDVIVELEGDATDTIGDLLAGLRRFEPGDTVSLVVARDGEEQTIDVVLAEESEIAAG